MPSYSSFQTFNTFHCHLDVHRNWDFKSIKLHSLMTSFPKESIWGANNKFQNLSNFISYLMNMLQVFGHIYSLYFIQHIITLQFHIFFPSLYKVHKPRWIKVSWCFHNKQWTCCWIWSSCSNLWTQLFGNPKITVNCIWNKRTMLKHFTADFLKNSVTGYMSRHGESLHQWQQFIEHHSCVIQNELLIFSETQNPFWKGEKCIATDHCRQPLMNFKTRNFEQWETSWQSWISACTTIISNNNNNNNNWLLKSLFLPLDVRYIQHESSRSYHFIWSTTVKKTILEIYYMLLIDFMILRLFNYDISTAEDI
jgi:hypothetical protein